MQALRKEVSEVARLTDGEQGFTPWEVPELIPVTCPELKGAGVRKRCGSSVVSANLFQLGGWGAVVE